MSLPLYDDGRKGLWRFHIRSYKMTSRRYGYDRMFPWIERGPLFEELSDSMICRKRVLVALTFVENVRTARSSPPWLVLVLSAPNLSIRPIKDNFVNGHEAFLTALKLEIDDAYDGLREASDRIGSATIPPVGSPTRG